MIFRIILNVYSEHYAGPIELILNYAIQMGQDVRLLKICNFCNKAFIAKNPKAEYDTYNCKNKANVYKSRTRSSNTVHTDTGIAVKLPSDDISEDFVKTLNKKIEIALILLFFGFFQSIILLSFQKKIFWKGGAISNDLF